MTEVRGHVAAGAAVAPRTGELGAQRPDLVPYIPRVVVEWLRTEPERTWREIDGTLAFVDISGFTAMSERLARQGKVGAEEVTEVMNRTFTHLLDVAYDNGGGLVKFGGDALLLLFTGENDTARAARAAFGMRKALRDLGPPKTSAGQVTLKMHVGIHTGTFHFFLVGSTHRELLITGPAASETVELEDASEAGDILLSPAAAGALPGQVIGDTKGGGILLRSDVALRNVEAAPLPPLRGTDDLEIGRCVPAPIRDHLAAGPAEPEHRQATIAFVHFDGTDALIRDEGPAAAAEALEELVVAVQEAAGEHEVCLFESDIDADGGKLVLVAGVPQSAGGDEERMLRTVCAVAAANARLPLRIGLHRGRVFAGEVGAPFRRTYTILGETAAVAARLMARAAPGQVLATPDVLERSRTTFDSTELEPFRVKGKSEPLRARDVHAVAGTRELEMHHLPFVGRERELAVVGAALAPVRIGFGSFVELSGDPGMGKSRLVEELRAQCPDLRQVQAGCEQYEMATAYFAFRGLLRSMLEVTADGNPSRTTEHLHDRLSQIAPDLVPWIPLLAIPLDVEVRNTREVDELQPAFRRARLHGVVEELLAALLPEPALLVFEDVHWMDEASCDLLRHLGGQVSKRPWLICATRRPVPGGFLAAEGVPPVPAMTIVLEPLTEEAAAALVEATAGAGMFEHEVSAITERAGGNPLFLQELVASPRAEEEEPLPETVESVMTTRIDTLQAGDRTLLRYAAVMGATFSGELIAEVLADDPEASADSEAWDRLAEFVERDPYTPGAFRFRHALFRDAAYEGLSYRRRRELHARVGEAYEHRYPDSTAEHAELLSLHFFHAQAWPKAYNYSLVAGERAQAKFANVEAASFYRRALDVSKHLELAAEDVSGLWEALGDVSELAGLYDDAKAAYRSARSAAPAGGKAAAMLLLKEGVIRERAARYADALRWYNRGLQAAEEITDESNRRYVRHELDLAYAGVRLRQGNFDDCIVWCRKVVDDAAPDAELPALAHAYYLMHLAYTSQDSPEKEALRGLALPIYEELGDLLGQANVLNNLGIDAYYDGRWDESLTLYRRSKELRERIGDVVGTATISNNIGEIKSDQGHLQPAEELFQETLEVCERAGYRYMAALATSNLGRAAARQGHFGDAQQLLHKALAEFHEIRAGSFVLETKARLAERAVLAGEPDEAIHQADETLRALVESGSAPTILAMLHRVRGSALVQLDDPDGAQQCFEESIRVARESGRTFELALSLEALAQLASATGDEAEAAACESADLLDGLGVISTPRSPAAPLPSRPLP
jgi:class 3 adenylate cyclase/tetratricopeptide (TPR) repeat protein